MNIVQLIINRFADIIGIIGVLMVLIAYFMLNTHKFLVLDMRYQLLNFVGSWFILYSLFYSWNLSSVLIEVAWILISIIGIYRVIKARNHD